MFIMKLLCVLYLISSFDKHRRCDVLYGHFSAGETEGQGTK